MHVEGKLEDGSNSADFSLPLRNLGVYDRVRMIVGRAQEANPQMISGIQLFLAEQNVPYLEATSSDETIRKAEIMLPLGNHMVQVENIFAKSKSDNVPSQRSNYTLYSLNKDKPLISLSYTDSATVIDIDGILGPSQIVGPGSKYFEYQDEVTAAGLNNINHAMILESLREAIKDGENSIYFEAVMAPALRLDKISELNQRYLPPALIKYE